MRNGRKASEREQPRLYERAAARARTGAARVAPAHRSYRHSMPPALSSAASAHGGGVPAEQMPLAESAVAVLDLPYPAPHTGTARPDILLVEDDPQTARVIAETLTLEGDPAWRIEAATDGRRALELAFAAPPRVVLLDVLLPGLDGGEVYRRLRANPRTSATRVLFLSAATSLDLYQRGIEAGVLLRKPFEVRELVRLVRTLLAE